MASGCGWCGPLTSSSSNPPLLAKIRPEKSFNFRPLQTAFDAQKGTIWGNLGRLTPKNRSISTSSTSVSVLGLVQNVLGGVGDLIEDVVGDLVDEDVFDLEHQSVLCSRACALRVKCAQEPRDLDTFGPDISEKMTKKVGFFAFQLLYLA